MKYVFLLLFSFLFGSGRIMAQEALNPKYTKKLQQMYKNSVPLIEPEAAAEMLSEEEDVLILDTRTEREFEVSHIAGATFVDFDHFNKKDFKNADRDKPVLVYCSVGYRSERIGEQLQKMGFTNVQNLYGGIFEWKNQGHPVENEQGETTEQVHTYNADWGKWLDQGEKITR